MKEVKKKVKKEGERPGPIPPFAEGSNFYFRLNIDFE